MLGKSELFIKESHSPEETYEFAKQLAGCAQAGEIYCLCGDLGVGKTVFTKGFAAGLGIAETVNSPTFTILQIYEDGRLPLYHFDVYRIADPYELDEIGYEDYFFGNGVCLVEWAELIEELLPAGCKRIKITKNLEKGSDFRVIEIRTSGLKAACGGRMEG